MATKLIEFEDGIMVEVAVLPQQAREISSRFAEKVEKNISSSIQSLLKGICGPVTASFREIHAMNKMEKAQIELSLNFEAEGNLYIANTKAGANLKITMTFLPGS